jgi:hypothetical protein
MLNLKYEVKEKKLTLERDYFSGGGVVREREMQENGRERERFVGGCVVLREKREKFGRESDLTCTIFTS